MNKGWIALVCDWVGHEVISGLNRPCSDRAARHTHNKYGGYAWNSDLLNSIGIINTLEY
jgi:hypothetical protein